MQLFLIPSHAVIPCVLIYITCIGEILFFFFEQVKTNLNIFLGGKGIVLPVSLLLLC